MKVRLIYVFTLTALFTTFAARTWGQERPKSRSVALDKLELHNVRTEPVVYLDRAAIRVSDSGLQNLDDAARFAVVPGTFFQDGTIEVDLSGDTAPNAPPELRGFVGIAFRVTTDRSHFECFYLRPKNGRSEDQLQRNHSAQYISMPGFGWQRLRSESPGKYESYVDLVPGQWTHVKIRVDGSHAQLYVNSAEQPTSGAIALWVGPGTIAHFSALHVAP